jgi:hypothetical protein
MEGNIQERYCQPRQGEGFETTESWLEVPKRAKRAKRRIEGVLPLCHSMFGCA